jgi:hypothetical protein
MDLNRKNRFGIKNMNTQMAASLMLKFVLVLAFFVMMAATAYAGAFLYEDGTAISTSGSILPAVENKSETGTEANPGIDTWEQWGLLDNNGEELGYYYNDDETLYKGFYLGTFAGNTNNGDTDIIKLIIEDFLGISDIEIEVAKPDDLDKLHDDPDGSDFINGENGLKVTVTDSDDEDLKSGTWHVTNASTNEDSEINFYTVKGGSEFALYYVNPADHEGNWTTAHLEVGRNDNQPEISHLAVYKSDINNVPEPATMLLFGFSLMGLAGMARRRNSKF